MVRRSLSWIEFTVAGIIRFMMMYSDFKQAILDRVEISTPLNSWKRLQEGIELFDNDIDPYTGDMFHESPILLIFFKWLTHAIGPYMYLFFISVDIATAFILFKTSSIYVHTLKTNDDKLISNVKAQKEESSVKVLPIDVEGVPILVAYAYLFNPYVILNCVAQTTTVISNFFLSVVLLTLTLRKTYISTMFLSLASVQTFYPVLLLVPIALHSYKVNNSKSSLVMCLLSYAAFTTSFIYLSHYITGSWFFLNSMYMFILNVNDLTPNIGLFWYFFTEMFEHFRSLFIAAFQINATILYLVPLSLHLRDEPMFLSTILLALIAIFKSYPSLGDVGLYLSLLPLWSHLLMFTKQIFVVACILIITSVLGPTVWHLWIYSGSANANFFFGVTLAFATAQIFLVTDLLLARKKRKYALKYGWPDHSSNRILSLE